MSGLPSIAEAVRTYAYPGRGLVLGTSKDGTKGVVLYFITARSENSRNRLLVADSTGIHTAIFDWNKLKDPSLILYSPLLLLPQGLVIGNGDQTETVRQGLQQGIHFGESLESRYFEPDSPHYTPRITGFLPRPRTGVTYEISLISSADGRGDLSRCQRSLFSYQGVAGTGHLVHTYQGGDQRLFSFAGEPRGVILEDDLPSMAETVWESLDPSLRVSLVAGWYDLNGQWDQVVLINHHVLGRQ